MYFVVLVLDHVMYISHFASYTKLLWAWIAHKLWNKFLGSWIPANVCVVLLHDTDLLPCVILHSICFLTRVPLLHIGSFRCDSGEKLAVGDVVFVMYIFCLVCGRMPILL